MNCDVVCLQETKREHFDVAYLKIFCHRHLDKFELHPLFVVLVASSPSGMAAIL
jgi:hypothetical protein